MDFSGVTKFGGVAKAAGEKGPVLEMRCPLPRVLFCFRFINRIFHVLCGGICRTGLDRTRKTSDSKSRTESTGRTNQILSGSGGIGVELTPQQGLTNSAVVSD